MHFRQASAKIQPKFRTLFLAVQVNISIGGRAPWAHPLATHMPYILVLWKLSIN